MKTAILASTHYFAQRTEASEALWFNIDDAIESEDKYRSWLDFIIPVLESNDIKRIFGLTDLTALVAAHCEFLLGSRSHESFVNIARCLNKPDVRARIGNKAYNVKTIKSFPSFVKPIHSSLSQGSGYVENEEIFHSHVEKHLESVYATTAKYRIFGKVAGIDFTENFHEFYGEECIEDGTQLTADVLADNGTITVLSVSESVFHEGIPSFNYFDFPYNCPREEMQVIQDATAEIAEILGLDNLLFNIEFIWTHQGQLKLIEVNPHPATQFLPAIKAVAGFDGWNYVATGNPIWLEPVTENMAIKIFRTKTDSAITYVPGMDLLARLKNELGVSYNSFAIEGKCLSEAQQDGYTYRIGEAYIPYGGTADREVAIKEVVNFLESEGPLIPAGEII